MGTFDHVLRPRFSVELSGLYGVRTLAPHSTTTESEASITVYCKVEFGREESLELPSAVAQLYSFLHETNTMLCAGGDFERAGPLATFHCSATSGLELDDITPCGADYGHDRGDITKNADHRVQLGKRTYGKGQPKNEETLDQTHAGRRDRGCQGNGVNVPTKVVAQACARVENLVYRDTQTSRNDESLLEPGSRISEIGRQN